MPQTVLIVDDDPTQRRLLETVIVKHGFRTLVVEDGEQALTILEDEGRHPVDAVLLDLVMPGVDGMAVLEKVRPARPQLPIIVLTAHGGVDNVVKAMRAGATDFLVKPAGPERLVVTIENALKLSTLSGEVSRLSRKIQGETQFDDLVAASKSMSRVVDLARRGAGSNIPMLIEGESGVGKELVARAIQGASDRAGKPFVVVNCGAIPENLVESILFGHEKGSFTGASERRIGKFQEASTGSLFLDEIGELRPDIQVKLLRALQEGEIDPIGAVKPVKVDIRLISATNRDLAQMVAEGTFREDLYYRLNVFPIYVPPLRERREDIEVLVDHFTAAFAASEGKNISGLTPEARKMLNTFDWPGNVRQLKNTIFRAVVLCDAEILDVPDFPQIAQLMGLAPQRPGFAARPGAGAAEAPQGNGISVINADGNIRALSDVEGDMVRFAIKKYNGQMSEVARRLGIGRSTLYRKVRDLGIDVRADA